jgi:hypothetical protein
VRELFAPHDVTPSFTKASNLFAFGSVDVYQTFFEHRYGPTIKAQEKLVPEGRWDECRVAHLRERTGGQLERERMPACDPGDTPGDQTAHTGAAQQGPCCLVAQVVEPDRAHQIAEVPLPRRGSVAPGQQQTHVLGQRRHE